MDPFEIFNISVAKHFKKIERGTLCERKFFEKKSHNAEKTEKKEPLVSPGIVCCADKKYQLFWLSSLGQMVQFDTLKFRRTFKNYFGQFVWIKKKSHW